MKTENNQPPSAEAVKAAFALADYGPGRSSEWMKVAERVYPHCEGKENVDQAAARILAAHARARVSEVARLREALERIDKGEKDTRAFRCGSLSHHELTREAMQDIARKALTGEAGA